MLPKTIAITLVLLAQQLHVTHGAFKSGSPYNLENDLPDYRTALDSDVIDAARYKRVTLVEGYICDPDESYCFANVEHATVDKYLMESNCTETVQCSHTCRNELDLSALTPITPSNSIQRLRDGEDVALGASTSGTENRNFTSYVLTLKLPS